MNRSSPNLRDFVQELYELGAKRTIFRVIWELRGHGGDVVPVQQLHDVAIGPDSHNWTARLPFWNPTSVAEALRDRIASLALDELVRTAERATRGQIECFGRWVANFGQPIDWHRSPLSGVYWNANTPWRQALRGQKDASDVKLSWEVARFPHAYHLSRATAFAPEHSERFGRALGEQICDFGNANPYGRGIHWASGQEVGFRLLAWLFSARTLLTGVGETQGLVQIRQSLLSGAAHIQSNLDFARLAVYNNHLLSEALALFAAGVLLPDMAVAREWRELGRTLLDGESQQQFYRDGAYIQQSHNYHRVALYDLLWACALAKSTGDQPSTSWLDAIARSVTFLVAHQNPADGRLPNYGSNDGSMPGIFSSCDFGDFRPVLQTANLLVHGQRLYDPGPWDEMAAWFLGPAALDQPLAPPRRASVSFEDTGYHVLRGQVEGTFATFRCGSLRDRFSQIDMLHLDVWWRGFNVLVDAGSYLYNDRPEWHNHFMRTACHNTMTVDGLDQMLHFRQFKVLYWTKAQLLAFEDHADFVVCSGEHYGYQRHRGHCIHRRSVLFLKDDVWVVVDRVTGAGPHNVRLHWLGGDFNYDYEQPSGRFRLATPEGPFTVSVADENGQPMEGDMVRGQNEPPRGWLSRYYGEKVPVPSLAVSRSGELPTTLVSVLSGVPCSWTVDDATWTLAIESREATFKLIDGRMDQVRVS